MMKSVKNIFIREWNFLKDIQYLRYYKTNLYSYDPQNYLFYGASFIAYRYSIRYNCNKYNFYTNWFTWYSFIRWFTIYFHNIDPTILKDPARVQDELKKFGIVGLVILEEGGLPLLIRDFDSRGIIDITNIELITGFISALIHYASSIGGFLTDVGLGNIRLWLKRSRNHIFCLFLDEKYSWRYNREQLSMLIEISLKNLVKTFKIFLELVGEGKVLMDRKLIKQFRFQADMTLLESFMIAMKHLNIEYIDI